MHRPRRTIPARRILREHREPGALLDALGAALLVAAVALLALGIVKGEDWGWDSSRVLASLAAGALIIPLAVVRSLRHPAPVIAPGLFRSRSFSVALAQRARGRSGVRSLIGRAPDH